MLVPQITVFLQSLVDEDAWELGSGDIPRIQNTVDALDDLPRLYATRNDPQHRMRPELSNG